MKLEKSDKRIVMFGAIFLVLSLAFLPVVSGDGLPSFPHTVEGLVCYLDDTPVVDAGVTLNNTRTSEEWETKTDEKGEWMVEVRSTIGARNEDEILITVLAPNSVEKEKNATLVINTSEFVQEANFVFEKQSEEGPPALPSDGGSTSDGLPGEKANATATEEGKGAENIRKLQPSPSPSGIIKEGRESVAGEGQTGTASPLKEEEEGAGKNRSSPGSQFLYAGAAGLIAIVGFFIIVKIRLIRKSKGGEEKR